MQFTYYDRMSSTTIGFAVSDEDRPRLDRLSTRFGGGNRSAFLRIALDHMEAVERAGQLVELQAYGNERSAVAGLSHRDAVAVVRRALKHR
jgi:hypothetical protein